MRTYRFHVVNVFAESTFGGNPLAVFEDARGLTDVEQQALADQFNLSETTFVWPSTTGAAARVRIYSPGYEMAFAGHPALGTAHIVRELLKAGDRFELELNIGPISVSAKGNRWELKSAKPSWSDVVDPPSLGLRPEQILAGARWVSTGMEQLIVPLRDVEAVRTARPHEPFPRNALGQVALYVFTPTPTGFVSRFFWDQHGVLREDPGTGSACANLGGWWLSQKQALPFEATVKQGHALNRLNVLSLRVDAEQNIFVGGQVRPLMRGEVQLP